MEIIHLNRSFTSKGFHNTNIVFRRKNELGTIHVAFSPEQFLLERIPTEADIAKCTFQRASALVEYLPVWEPYMLQVSEAIPLSEIHIKELQSYAYIDAPEWVATRTVKDLENCQMLMQHPHPNVLPYLGCLVEDGRVTGLCFKKASKTLMEMVNPKMVLKVKFDASCYPLPNKEKLLQGWEAGIRHIHSIGYVHNDVHPTNLMVLDDGTPVVIDFDMLTKKGAIQYGGRFEWSDQEVNVASEKRDWDGMQEIRTWLDEGTEKKWLFGSHLDLVLY
jgi:serine/threonine protein kinase